MDYYADAGVLPAMEKLGFHLVGYGCTTCIGNSGPLPDPVTKAVTEGKLTVAAVLSGNRNFEGRVNPLVKANYLASPPLVVAYAIAGRIDLDLVRDPLGLGKDGQPVYLRDIWPADEEIDQAVSASVRREMFEKQYSVVFEGDSHWRNIRTATGDLFQWEPESTYIRHPPYFENMTDPSAAAQDLAGLRVLALLGDSITTDHISPAGSIAKDSPAARYLMEHGVAPPDFNQYGARRGNHEVMMRGTLANIRLRNMLASGAEGAWTTHQPSGEKMFIYDASVRYKAEGVGLLIIAGKEYGSGSSRDWAAKGVQLLGVRAVIAESYERIHRSNLVGMGVLPLEFLPGENRESLGLAGTETFSIEGVAEGIATTRRATVRAEHASGGVKMFTVRVRVDTPTEADYYRHGGILPYVLRQLAATATPARA
jgi:aconitate hydratase